MPRNKRTQISRRALLQVGIAGSGVFLGGLVSSPVAAAAADIVAPPGKSTITGPAGFTDLQGVHAEYRAASIKFPLPLPDGWSFPPESALRNSERDVLWERGSGEAEVYLYWQRAVVTAAQDAHARGDVAEADRLLDLLEAGYSTPTRRAVFEDPTRAFVTQGIDPARSSHAKARGVVGGGDFSKLVEAVAPR